MRMCANIGKRGRRNYRGEREPVIKFRASLYVYCRGVDDGDDAGIGFLVHVSGDFRLLWPAKWISKGRFRRPKMLRITNKRERMTATFLSVCHCARVI